MSNRIDLTQEELREKLFKRMTKDYDANQFIDNTGEWEEIDEIMDGIEHLGLLAELKRCYELIDSLPTREGLNEMHDYTKWLETVELYFIANGSFNQDADFVRMCAVNEKYGYRIEVINGVETVVHESEY